MITFVIHVSLILLCRSIHIAHGKLKVELLDGPNCIVNDNAASGNVTTISTSSRYKCSLKITSTQGHPTLLQVQDGSLSGIDYMYMEKLGGDDTCGTRYVALKGPKLTPCKITLPSAWMLHFHGEIALKVQEIQTDSTAQDPNPALDPCTNQAAQCQGLQEYSYVVACHTWFIHAVCTLSYSPNCTCHLDGEAVVSECQEGNQKYFYKGLLAFPYNVSEYVYLNITQQNLTALARGTFEDIGEFMPNCLYLDKNAIYNVVEGTFLGLDHLTALSLNENNLRTLHNGSFKGVEGLFRLKLKSNRLETIEAGAFSNLSRLQYITLQNNRLKTINQGVFNGMGSLNQLDLADNCLVHLPLDLFKDLVNLTWLGLSNNTLNTLPMLGHMSVLMTLKLWGNDLFSVVRKVFKGLPTNLTTIVDQHEVCECFLDNKHPDYCIAQNKRSPYLTCERLLAEIVLAILTWIIGFCALFGNIFVLCWRKMRKEKENKIQSLLVRNLAVSDLLMGIYMLIVASADAHYGIFFPMHSEAWRKGALCRIAGVLAITSSEASVFFITLISIDRFLCIKYPSPSSRTHTTKTCVVVTIAWITALLLGLVPSVLSGRNPDFYDNSHVCIGLPLSRKQKHTQLQIQIPQSNIDDRLPKVGFNTTKAEGEEPAMYFSSALFLGLNLVCFLVILVCYLEIIRTVYMSQRRNQRDMKKQLQLTKRVSAIVATDFCSWFPIIFIGILVQSGAITISPTVFAWMVSIVLPINSAINPFVYTISVHRRNWKISKQPVENMEIRALNRQIDNDDQGLKTNMTLISQRNGMEDSQM